jgi:hypothetical protein
MIGSVVKRILTIQSNNSITSKKTLDTCIYSAYMQIATKKKQVLVFFHTKISCTYILILFFTIFAEKKYLTTN